MAAGQPTAIIEYYKEAGIARAFLIKKAGKILSAGDSRTPVLSDWRAPAKTELSTAASE